MRIAWRLSRQIPQMGTRTTRMAVVSPDRFLGMLQCFNPAMFEVVSVLPSPRDSYTLPWHCVDLQPLVLSCPCCPYLFTLQPEGHRRDKTSIVTANFVDDSMIVVHVPRGLYACRPLATMNARQVACDLMPAAVAIGAMGILHIHGRAAVLSRSGSSYNYSNFSYFFFLDLLFYFTTCRIIVICPGPMHTY